MANINNRGVSVITKEFDIGNTNTKVLNSPLIKITKLVIFSKGKSLGRIFSRTFQHLFLQGVTD